MNFSDEAIGFIREACKETEITRPLRDFPEYALATCTFRNREAGDGRCGFLIVPRPPQAERGEIFAAQIRSDAIQSFMGHLRGFMDAAVIYEDRWYRENGNIRLRIEARISHFEQIMGRKCTVRRITGPEADDFLDRYHSYGSSKCKYRYGTFSQEGRLIAVSTFSGARRWQKPEGTVSSYEWIRYASLPGMRIAGGMGKSLNAFIAETAPDDIMSYADLEWSDGRVYETLGFAFENVTPPQSFIVSGNKREPMKRLSEKSAMEIIGNDPDAYIICNLGSGKFRLKRKAWQSPLPKEPPRLALQSSASPKD